MTYQQNPAVDYIDKVDLQLLTQNLIYWQRKAEQKTKGVMDAFSDLSDFYRVNQVYAKTITRPSIRRGVKVTKKFEVIYQYSTAGEKQYEKNMQILEVETSTVYPILLHLLQKLYYMKPDSEVSTKEEFTETDPELADQAGFVPEKKITTEHSNTFARMFSLFSTPKVPTSLDDISSPYRRTHDMIDEIQNLPALLERLNSYHEFRIADANTDGLGKYYQINARQVEKYYLKSIIRPKILKIVNAGNMVNLELEQQKIVGVLGLAYREKNIHRPFEMLNQPALPPPKQFW